MAKKTAPATPPSPQEDELFVTVFRFRGSPETMRKGFEAFGSALGAALGSGAPALRQISGNGRKAPAQIGASAEAQDDIEVDAVDEEQQEETETEEVAAPAAPKPRKPKASRGNYLKDFNLAPEGVPSLKDFVAGKDDDSEGNRYLLITSWLKQHGGADPFTLDHLFTCFRELSWTGRTDLMQTVRELASSKSYFANKERGQYQLTGTGERAAAAIGQKAQ